MITSYVKYSVNHSDTLSKHLGERWRLDGSNLWLFHFITTLDEEQKCTCLKNNQLFQNEGLCPKNVLNWYGNMWRGCDLLERDGVFPEMDYRVVLSEEGNVYWSKKRKSTDHLNWHQNLSKKVVLALHGVGEQQALMVLIQRRKTKRPFSTITLHCQFMYTFVFLKVRYATFPYNRPLHVWCYHLYWRNSLANCNVTWNF